MRTGLVALLLLLQLLALRQARAGSGLQYSCHTSNSVYWRSGVHALLPGPNTTFYVAHKMAFMSSSVITLFRWSDADPAYPAEYEIIVNPIERKILIRRADGDPTAATPAAAEASGSVASAAMPVPLFSPAVYQYIWVRVASLADGSGEISVGRAGRDEALVTYKEAHFHAPNAYRFRPQQNWVHNCTAAPATGFAAALGCRRSFSSSMRYGLYLTKTSFAIGHEGVPWGEAATAVRFMVKAASKAYVDLSGPPSQATHYRIGLGTIGKMNIVRNGVDELDSCPCHGCLSAEEYRLFTILFNDTRLEVYEGLSDKPALSAAKPKAFEITNIAFSSAHFVSSTWLHECQGYNATEAAAGREAEVATLPSVPTVPPATQGKGVQEALAMASTCRVVHTFKYRFDSYYAIAEEGIVAGSFSALTFSVAARRDIHLQFSSTIPPPPDDVYEMDIGFYNYTNLDRGKETKVATVKQHDLLTENELRTFTVAHDLITGTINVTSADGQLQLTWNDRNPFPLRYFSISSGSSAGNNTVWVFGCGHKRDVKDGCSRPLITHAYSHSQYFSVEREGVVNGSRRTIFVHLRASGSGHIRLENVLPPAVDALFEVDLAHEGQTSIDALGRRMATVRTPGLLNISETRGFWVRQDMAARTLAVGKAGDEEPLLEWTAPPGAKFPELRVFSLATSKSVGNGTWFYGCKEGQKPDEKIDTHGEVEAVPDEDSDEDNTEEARRLNVTGLTNFDQFREVLISNLSNYAPRQGTNFSVDLNVTKVYLNDMNGMIMLNGHVFVAWSAPSLRWDPDDYDGIRVIANDGLADYLAPSFYVPSGDAPRGGTLRLFHDGRVLWEAPLGASAYCHGLDAGQWPNDQHTCRLQLALSGPGTEGCALHLAGHAFHGSAARPVWTLVYKSVSVIHNVSSPVLATMDAVDIVVTLRRNTPVMNRILVAPFIVLAALSLLAYWVEEPLPRDKAFLGCGSLVLLVLSFLMFELACPPGLVGLPLVLEVYCYAACVVALSVAASAILAAVARASARDVVVRGPPLLVCRALNLSLVRLLLCLSSDQVLHRISGPELDGDGEYKEGSSQLYTRFGSNPTEKCGCNNTSCSKQAAIEARYYWTLLSIAIERLLSLICVVLLVCASLLVK